jgi:hypothetical protein
VSVSNWTEVDTAKAQQIWSSYQQQNDLTAKLGQTAGIDPVSGRIWFGSSVKNVVAELQAAGLAPTPLFFVRVGSSFYHRKGSHR